MGVSSGAYAPCVLPVTLYHGLFTCCFAYDVCVVNKFDLI